MKIISITGADATGKTSLIQNLIQMKIPEVKIFFSPHFHKTEENPLNETSIVFEKINSIANQKKLPSLKAVALLLGMSLYSSYQKFYIKKYNPQFLVSERHCVIDALAFFPIYKEKISGITNLDIPWNLWLNQQELLVFKQALQQITQNIKTYPAQDSWEALMLWIQGLVHLDPIKSLKAWSDFYSTTLPDQILILTAEFSTLQRRVNLREQQGKKTEWHEQGQALLKLQDSFLKLGQWLEENQLSKVRVIKTDNISSEELAHQVAIKEFSA